MSTQEVTQSRPGPTPSVQVVIPRALIGYWRLFGSVFGTAAVVVGFIGIVVSWYGSGSEIDIRQQMQELISSIGFLALILVGMLLLVGEIFASMRQSLAPQLDAIASALEELAAARAAQPVAGGSGADEPAAEVSP